MTTPFQDCIDTFIESGRLYETQNLGAAGMPFSDHGILQDFYGVAWPILTAGADEPWDNLGSSLSEVPLRRLVRGLVLYGELSRDRGSVSPVINLCRAFARRFPQSEPELIEWVVANRVNDYEPFGSLVLNWHSSFSDRERGLRLREVESEKKRAVDRLRGEEARSLKRLRESEKATQDLLGAVRRGDLPAVRALLAKGASLQHYRNSGQSLLALAEANGRQALAEFLHGIGAP